jgi:hypothetical protein
VEILVLSSSYQNRIVSVLAGIGVLVLSVTPLHAQVRVLPQFSQPSMSTRIGAAQANWSQLTHGGNRPVFRGGFNPYLHRGGGWGGGWGGNVFWMDPNYGYLRGAAQVIGAQAEFMQAQQQAALTQEQVRQAQLETRRQVWDQWRYEQANQPTAAEIQARQWQAELDRARNNPPAVDIWSGEALNVLLRSIQHLQGQGAVGPTVLVEPAVLPLITVTDGISFGQGLLSQGPAALTWPFAIEGFAFFDAGRKRMDKAMRQAIEQSRSGKRVEALLISEMSTTLDELRATLRAHIHDLTPSQGVQARRFLNELHETIRTLQRPNAANFASGKWAARGDTVAELVLNLTRDGLRFAPAVLGSEFAYNSLYQSLRQYEGALAQR